MGGRFRIQQLSKKYLDQSLKLLANTFLHDSVISQAVDFKNHPEAAEEYLPILAKIAEQGVSVIAVDRLTDKVEAILLNQIAVPHDAASERNRENLLQSFQHEQSRKYLQYSIGVHKIFKNHIDPQIKAGFYFSVACTSPAFRGAGLLVKLAALSIRLAEQLSRGINVKLSVREDVKLDLDLRPEMIVAPCTSKQAFKIATEKFDFEVVTEVSVRDVEFRGKKVLDSVCVDGATEWLLVKKLNCRAATSKL